jgi:hypothetical protein
VAEKKMHEEKKSLRPPIIHSLPCDLRMVHPAQVLQIGKGVAISTFTDRLTMVYFFTGTKDVFSSAQFTEREDTNEKSAGFAPTRGPVEFALSMAGLRIVLQPLMLFAVLFAL